MSRRRPIDPGEEPQKAPDRRYLSLTSGMEDCVWMPDDPQAGKEYYEQKKKRARLSWGMQDDQFISDLTADDRRVLEYRKRRRSLMIGGALSMVFFTLFLLVVTLGDGNVSLLDALLWAVVASSAIIISAGSFVLLKKMYAAQVRDSSDEVVIPNGVVELTKKYLSVTFKGSPNSELYLLYYDQMRGAERITNGRFARRSPFGDPKGGFDPGPDPERTHDGIFPAGTPKRYIIRIGLKKKTVISPRKMMTLHFRTGTRLPNKEIYSDRVLISIRPGEQEAFLGKLRRKLDDRRSYEGQEFYPEWE